MADLIDEALTMRDISDDLIPPVLTGSTTDVNALVGDIQWIILDTDDDLPPTIGELAKADAAYAAETVAQEVWRYCYERSQAWADKTSDATRVMAAFKVLETRGIVTGMFEFWDSVESDGSKAGMALVWDNEWESLEPDDESTLLIRILDVREPVEKVAQQVIDALAEQGLTGRAVDEGVEVPVHWRWPVKPANRFRNSGGRASPSRSQRTGKSGRLRLPRPTHKLRNLASNGSAASRRNCS